MYTEWYFSISGKSLCTCKVTVCFIVLILSVPGVDIVINSLAGEKLKATLNLVARDGHFLEIGKFDLSQNSQLGG